MCGYLVIYGKEETARGKKLRAEINPSTVLYMTPLLLVLLGCASLPSDGPASEEILAQGQTTLETIDQGTLAYNVRPITAALPASTVHRVRTGFSERYRGKRQAPNIIDAGDTIEMTLWENSEVGLLAPQGQRSSQVNLTVYDDGTIDAPYIGSVPAKGETLSALRDTLMARYRQQAINPDVILTRQASTSRLASILGDVQADGRIEIPLNGLSLTEMIAEAGGIAAPAWEIEVHVRRAGFSETALLADIARDPQNDVTILPGDIVRVVHMPRLFTVMGAVNSPGATVVETEAVSILDLLSAAGGLQTELADPEAVFIYRDGIQPTVFFLDLNQPDSLFLGERFEVRQDDIIYVGTADAVTFERFISLIFSPLDTLGSSF